MLSAYQHYCLANKIIWVQPKIKCQSAPIIVPTEERIDKIIGRCSLKYITTFQISKHGLRPDEVSKIVLRDVDLQRGLLSVRTSKLGAERTIKLKEYANENLRTYIQRNNITRLDTPLFSKPSILRDQWNTYRKRAYLNFRDQELLKIRLYDLRHWFATTGVLEKSRHFSCEVFDGSQRHQEYSNLHAYSSRNRQLRRRLRLQGCSNSGRSL